MQTVNLLSKRAYLTPDREALLFIGDGAPQRYTYAELNARANRLANWLHDDLGIRKGDRVSMLAHNSMAYIDCFYGLAKLGAIFAPLNWRLAANELRYIINDCEPAVLIAGPEFADVVAEFRSDVHIDHYVALEGAEIDGAMSYEASVAQASEAEPPSPPLDDDDTWAILYTSGTTGRPKGAMIPHRQVVYNCINTIASWGLTEYDVSPVYTPLFHAGGLFAFLTPLLYVGGRVIVTRTFELEETVQIIDDEGCTV
ncbi:MAG: AMP-binding protein, partial [Anaerolineae bacterium]|nr:AMP-binding protein [Anaerolineae bacterium]